MPTEHLSPSCLSTTIQESSPYWFHCSHGPSGLFSPNTLHKALTLALLSHRWRRGCAVLCGHHRAPRTKDTQEVMPPAWHQEWLWAHLLVSISCKRPQLYCKVCCTSGGPPATRMDLFSSTMGRKCWCKAGQGAPQSCPGRGQDASAGCAGFCVPGHNEEDTCESLHHFSRACIGTCCCCREAQRSSPFLTSASDFAAHIKYPTLPRLTTVLPCFRYL